MTLIETDFFGSCMAATMCTVFLIVIPISVILQKKQETWIYMLLALSYLLCIFCLIVFTKKCMSSYTKIRGHKSKSRFRLKKT